MANSVLAKMAVQIVANTAQFNKSLAESSTRLAALQKTVAKTNTALIGFGVGFGAFQIANVIGSAIRSISEFEKQLSTVKAITGATGREFDNLKQNALELGRTTKFTSTQVAELQVAYGRLGFSTKEILDATEATLFLAAATGEDLAKSADVAGSTVRGFGLNAEETLRVVDVMASSFNKTALSLENFTESMKYVAPIANAAGASVEETTALLGVLADAGVRGSQAGTSLRKIFTDMTKDGRPLKERLKELGDRGITLSDSFDEVGRTAQTALLILSKNTEKTDLLTNALLKSSGEAEKAARIMEDNLAGSLIKLSSAYDGAVQSSGPLTEGLRDIVDVTTRLINLSVNEGAGIFKYLNLLISYTPNIVTLSRVLNRILPDVKTPLEELNEAIANFQENFNYDVGAEAKTALNELALMAEKAGVSLVKLKDETGKVRIVIKPFADTIKQGTDAINGLGGAVVGYFPTIKELKDQKDKLIKQFDEETDRTDQKELANIGAKIIGLDAQIKKLEELRTAQMNAKNRGEATPLRTDLTPSAQSSASIFGLGNISVPGIEEITKAIEIVNQKFIEGQMSVKAWGAIMKIIMEETAKNTIDASGLIAGGIADIASAFGEAAVTGAKDFGRAFLRSLGRFAQQFGALLIVTGLGERALKSGNPKLMIAGGAALIAAGAAISALMANKPSLSGGSGGGFVSRGNEFAARQSLILEGNFRIDGRDLVLAYDKNKSLDSKRK